jgi:hypothetical protein
MPPPPGQEMGRSRMSVRSCRPPQANRPQGPSHMCSVDRAEAKGRAHSTPRPARRLPAGWPARQPAGNPPSVGQGRDDHGDDP